MTTKKIDELPVSQLTTQEALAAYIPISGIGGDGDELQKINFANLKSMLLDNRAVEPHEYWRVYYDANNSTSFCGLTELQFFKANSITNAVTLYPGTPLSSGGTPALAFDNGASSSGWNVAGSNQQWIGYHFSKAVGIARVRITAAQFTDQSPKDFRVQFSDNGTDWTDAWTVTGQTDWFNAEVRQYIDPDPIWIAAGEGEVAEANKRIWAMYDAANNAKRAGNGLTFVKNGPGNYQVNFDVPRQDTNYAVLMGTADMGYGYGSNCMIYWNTKTVDGFNVSSYSVETRARYDPLLSIEVIDSSNDTLGGFTDAPIDGKVYARKNGKWVQVGGSGSVERVKAAAHVRVEYSSPTVISGTTITKGFNVSGVSRTAKGRYRVTFTSTLDSNEYGVNISAGLGQYDDNWLSVATVDRHVGYGFSTQSIDILVSNNFENALYDPMWFAFEVYDPAVQGGGGGGSSGGIGDEAPTDGKGYVRRNADWDSPKLTDDADVDLTVAPNQGQSLVYDAQSQKWKAGSPGSKRTAKIVQVGNSGDLTAITMPANPTVGNLLVYVGAHANAIPNAAAGWTTLQSAGDPGGRVNAAVLYRMVDTVTASSTLIHPVTQGYDYGTGTVYEVNIGGRSGAAAITRADLFMESSPSPYQVTSDSLVLAVSVQRPDGSTVTMGSNWIADGFGDGDNRNAFPFHQYVVSGTAPDFGIAFNGGSEHFTAIIYIDNDENSIKEAPLDGDNYGRKNGGWAKAVGEAPSDGRQYARKDGGWSQVAATGGGSAGGNSKEGRLFVAGGVFEFDSSATMLVNKVSGCIVERVGAGRYKVTLDQPMANTDYGVLATGKWTGEAAGSYTAPIVGMDRGYAGAITTTTFYLLSKEEANSTLFDSRISFSVFESGDALTQLLGGGIDAEGVQGLANIRQAIKLAEVQYPVTTNTSDLASPRFDYKLDWGGVVALAYHGQIKSGAKVPATNATYQVPAGKKVYLIDGWGGTQNISNGGYYGHRLFNVTQNVSMASPNTGQTNGDGWQLIDGALTNGNANSIQSSAKVIGVAGDLLQCEIWNPSGDGNTRMNMGVYILAVVDANTNALAAMTPDALIGTKAKNAIFNYQPVSIVQIANGAKHNGNTVPVVFNTAPTLGNTILLLVAAFSGATVTVPTGFERIVYSIPSANQGFFAFRKVSNGTETSLSVSINDGGSAVAYELSGEIANINFTVVGSVPQNYNYFVNNTLYGDVPLRFIIAEHDTTPAVTVTHAKFTLDYSGVGSGNHAGVYGRVTGDFGGVLPINFGDGANNFVGELTVTGPRVIVPVIGKTPDIAGKANKVLAVNSAATGLEWVTPASGGSGGSADYPDFEDNAGKVLAVNSSEDGVEWVSRGGQSLGGVLRVRDDFAPPLSTTFPVITGVASTLIDNEDFGLLFSNTAGSASADAIAGIWKAKPTGSTWSVIGRIGMSGPSISNTSYHLGVRNSTTGNTVTVGNTTFSDATTGIEVNRWGPTAYSAMASPPRIKSNFDHDFWKVEYDGTNLLFYTSNNNKSWFYLGAESPGAFVGAFDQVGFLVNNKTNATGVITAAISYYSDSSTPARATPMLIGGAAPWSVTATGTAASQNITIPENGLDTNSVLVFFNGIKQPSSSYVINATTLTLTSNAVGDAIEIQRAAAASPSMTATIVASSADFTLNIGHLGQYQRVGNAAEVTITVPTNASVPFPIGSQMNFVQTGEGQLIFSPASGVVINYAESLKTRKKLSAATLTKVAADEWDILGDMEMSGPEGAKFTPPQASAWTANDGNVTPATVRDLPNSAGLIIEQTITTSGSRWGSYRGMAAPVGAHTIDLVYSIFRANRDDYLFFGPGYMQSGTARVAGFAHADFAANLFVFGSPLKWTAWDSTEAGASDVASNDLNDSLETLKMLHLRIINDGTTIRYLRSLDDGAHWIEIASTTIANAFTATPNVFGFLTFGTASSGTAKIIVHDMKVTYQ